MSLGEGAPEAGLPTTHYFLSLSRGDAIRTVMAPRAVVWAIAAVAALLLAWTAFVTAYLALHDDLMRAVIVRQAEMAKAYESRLAEARARLDEVASLRALDQTSFEARLAMCGWPPRCKGFVGGFDVGSAASMCPAYNSRPQPLALMRSADRVLIKLTRSRRSQVYGVSRSRRSTVASSPPSAPMHHNRPHPSEAGDIPMPFDRPRRASARPTRFSPSCWRAPRRRA
jgi:hypothetical protein